MHARKNKQKRGEKRKKKAPHEIPETALVKIAFDEVLEVPLRHLFLFI
jgi:hypothetical protein